MSLNNEEVKQINENVTYVVQKYLGIKKNHELALHECAEYLDLWMSMPEEEQKRFKKLQLLEKLGNTSATYFKVVMATNPIGWTYFIGKSIFKMGKMSEKDKMIMELKSEPFAKLLIAMREGQIYKEIRIE
jgi:hypothetical protein